MRYIFSFKKEGLEKKGGERHNTGRDFFRTQYQRQRTTWYLRNRSWDGRNAGIYANWNTRSGKRWS